MTKGGRSSPEGSPAPGKSDQPKVLVMAVDLSTRYLGLELSSPLVAGASPLTIDLDVLQRLQDAGAGAVVMPSLFAEQFERDEHLWTWLHEFQPEELPDLPQLYAQLKDYNQGPVQYLRLLEQARQRLSVPVIASINAQAPGDWTRFATWLEQAGADALELNIYYVPTRPEVSSQQVEQQYLEVVQQVRQATRLPLAVKIGPYFTSLPHFAAQLVASGAEALVLFNRYLEPDVNLEKMCIEPVLVLSSRHELRLPLRWISVLRDQLSADLAASSGVQQPEDVVKALAVGADVVMVVGHVLRHGPQALAELVEGLRRWLEEHETTLDELRGRLSMSRCGDPASLQRANYMQTVVSYRTS